MAKGDKFAFKDYPDVPKVCDTCGKPLRVQDVRHVSEIPRRYFECSDCWPPHAAA